MTDSYNEASALIKLFAPAQDGFLFFYWQPNRPLRGKPAQRRQIECHSEEKQGQALLWDFLLVLTGLPAACRDQQTADSVECLQSVSDTAQVSAGQLTKGSDVYIYMWDLFYLGKSFLLICVVWFF